MLLNFVHYSDPEVMALVNDSVKNGMNFQYRSRNLVQKTVPALGAGVTATTDIQLGSKTDLFKEFYYKNSM